MDTEGIFSHLVGVATTLALRPRSIEEGKRKDEKSTFRGAGTLVKPSSHGKGMPGLRTTTVVS